jgi:hypothetical protein
VKIWFEDPGKMAPVSLFSSFFPQTIMQEQWKYTCYINYK